MSRARPVIENRTLMKTWPSSVSMMKDVQTTAAYRARRLSWQNTTCSGRDARYEGRGWGGRGRGTSGGGNGDLGTEPVSEGHRIQ
jgi:hypothetical protein